MSAFVLGAVAYDPKVVTIWEGFKAWFATHDFDFDFVLYSNYESQVAAHFAGAFDVAWNSPLAWVQSERIAARLGRSASAFAMRDSDQDLTSVVIVRADSGITALSDLAGKTVAVGAPDSPQATLIPLLHLLEAGLKPGSDFEVQRHDLLVGKHGDHIGGEREAARALIDGRADAACMIDANLLGFSADGTLPARSTAALAQTEPYDHCVFTALDGVDAPTLERFKALILAMSYDDPAVRPLLELEGLKQWQEGRTSGFAQLRRAVDAFGTIDDFVAGVAG